MPGRRRQHDNSPTLAERFELTRADYQAAKSSRFRRRRTGVAAMGSGADYHYRSEADFLRLMEQARDMDRNDVIVGQIVDRAVANTIQDGIKLDPQTGDEKLDADLLARWTEWAEDADACDLAGEHCFSDIETLCLRQSFVDGDILALPNLNGALELVEAHRLRSPRKTQKNIVHGVLLDDARRRLSYWLTPTEINPYSAAPKISDMKSVDARDADGNRQVFHIYTPKRMSQTRGVTAFAPIFDTLGMFEDINFAKLIQQQIVSCFAIFRQRESELGPPSGQRGEQTADTFADGRSRTLEGIAPGMEILGAPGETLSMQSPNVPNPEYFPHVRLLLTLIGINVGLPLVLVLLDASETNFSGWRGAVDQARLGFRRNQGALIRKLHRPVYLFKLRQWMADDSALRNFALRNDRTSIKRHRWNPPGWKYIEPFKDAKADAIRLDKGLISPRRIYAEKGIEYPEVAAEIIEDRGLLIVGAIELAKKINAEHPEAGVGWREIAGYAPQGRGARKGNTG